MTEFLSCPASSPTRSDARRKRRAGWGRQAIPALTGLAILLVAAGTAPAQEKPLPPPDTPPESRLTVTPSEFERWLGRIPADDGAASEPEDATSRMGSPPPPPVLTAPPPPPPKLPLPASPVTAPPPPELGLPAKPPAAAIIPTESGANSPSAATGPDAKKPRPEPVRIVYAEEATAVPASALPALDKLTVWLRDNPDVRIELLGYASESSKTGSQARRRSLQRVLAVRDYLIGQGVPGTRMTVRALGDQGADGPRDRVEVKLPPS